MENDAALEKQRRDLQVHGYEILCWGCGLQLLLPSFVPVFKCGWCGAITSHEAHSEKQQRCSHCAHIVDGIFVPVVLLLIFLIICAGLWAVFPILFPRPSFGLLFHCIITIVLAFNTLFNYCLAAFMPAGPPPELTWGSFQFVSKGVLEGHRFCNPCKKPKPPGAHHCRMCKACVLEMDHHCPFIGNCVGAANQRPFILFLLYAVISNLYVLVMSIYTGLKIWPDFVILPTRTIPMGWRISDISAPYIRALLGSSVYFSARAISLVYLAVASLSISLVVGLLLHQQLQSLYSGQTYIDSLQAGNNILAEDPRARKGWKNLQRVFGPMHPLKWFFPRLVYADVVGKKVHEV